MIVIILLNFLYGMHQQNHFLKKDLQCIMCVMKKCYSYK